MLCVWLVLLSDFILLQDKQSTYYVTLRSVRATIVYTRVGILIVATIYLQLI